MPKPEWCICDPAFTDRGRSDPRCRHDELEDRDLLEAIFCQAFASGHFWVGSWKHALSVHYALIADDGPNSPTDGGEYNVILTEEQYRYLMYVKEYRCSAPTPPE